MAPGNALKGIVSQSAYDETFSEHGFQVSGVSPAAGKPETFCKMAGPQDAGHHILSIEGRPDSIVHLWR
jgi:hypothetical protein